MKSNSLISAACLLGALLFPGLSGLAQDSSGDGTGRVPFKVRVSALPDQLKGRAGGALARLDSAKVYLTLSDGRHLSMLSSGGGIASFKDLPAGSEYVVEIAAKGYSQTIYHGRVPGKSGAPRDCFTVNSSLASAAEPSPFQDSGPADVEGFVVCPMERLQWVSEPLPDAFVLFTSSSDSVYTTTDQHGYFRFDGVKDKKGKVSVSHMTCKSVEASVPPTDGSRWLWIQTKQDPLKLAAAKVTDSMPVISIVGDTIRYNVAATQKVMRGDRLADVLVRLPGVTIQNGMVTVLGKPLSEILINQSDLFGRNQHDALSYLAGVQINKIDIYEKEDERNPHGGNKRVVMNVKTKRALKNITDIDVSAAGGGNLPLSVGSIWPPERWQAGLGGRYFSVPTIATVDLGVNNLGIESGLDLSKIPDARVGNSELVKPVFASVKVQQALELNKEKTYAVQTIGFDYSFKKLEKSSRKETEKSYDPDDDWISREYESSQSAWDRTHTHRGELRWHNQKKWYPHASIAFSRNETGRQTDFYSMDRTLSADKGDHEKVLHQISELNARNYRIEGSAGVQRSLQDFSVNANLSFSGGEGDGSEIRSDSTATQKTWIASDEGKNRHLTATVGVGKNLDPGRISCTYTFNYDHGLQRKLKYDEVMDDAHLSPLTSEESRSNLYRHTVNASYDFEKFRVNAGFQASHVLDSRELPYHEKVDKFFPAPVFSAEWKPFGDRYNWFSLRIGSQSSAPTLNQLGSVFHDSTPYAVSRGNPDLKQTHTLSLSASGNNLVTGGTLDYSSRFSYRINEVVSTRTYYAEDTTLDGYLLPAGSTFSTFANSTGGMSWNNSIRYSVYVRPLLYRMELSAVYFFSKSPSFVNERFEYYNKHNPSLSVSASSNFSSRCKLDFGVSGSMSLTDSPYYGASRYSNLSASVSSDNRITEWLFVRARYWHSTRFPMSERVSRVDRDMLNVSTGVYLMDHRLCIALVFRDILNNFPSISTSAYANYLETVRTTNLNRYMLLSIRYNFNSSEKY